MKKIGILGGMSPESTTLYYEHITRTYTARFGDYGYPEILIYSVNFQKFVDWQHNGQWSEAARAMAEALERLHGAGADFGLIATNTMHIVFEEVQQAVHMPLLSIVQATAEAILAAGLRSVGLLGTKFTMSEPFFRDALKRSGITVLVPETGDQQRVNDVSEVSLVRRVGRCLVGRVSPAPWRLEKQKIAGASVRVRSALAADIEEPVQGWRRHLRLGVCAPGGTCMMRPRKTQTLKTASAPASDVSYQADGSAASGTSIGNGSRG